MDAGQIKEIQRRIGTTTDGFWGPKSEAAVRVHLRSLMPKKNPWPATDQASLTAFYGEPGDESQLVFADVSGLGLKYDVVPVHRIRCHAKVADSLVRVLRAVSQGPDRHLLQLYAGVYNNRLMRGGSLPSLHARGAAIDIDPGANANATHWPSKATMPLAVMECFAREGWLSAGAMWSRDAMHFQATL
jgi:hypothetical protein